jgi:hypothetical protein
MGTSDLSMADTLYHFMVGGHKRPLVIIYITITIFVTVKFFSLFQRYVLFTLIVKW